jgi:biotin carboxyl carrier protein
LEYGESLVRYNVTLASGTHVVDVVDLPNGSLQVNVDGRPYHAEVVAAGGQMSIRIDSHIVDLTIEGRLPEIQVVASGARLHARVESEREASTARVGKAGSNPSEKVVRSPMPGRVVKVLVVKGELVRNGQGLVVLEAMKMESEVRARAAGTVVDVHVMAGTPVEANAKLVTLE